MLKSEMKSKTTPILGTELREAASAAWKVEWTEFAVLPALRCVPGMAIVLLLGLAYHDMVAGVMAAGGALTVGFGSFYRFRWSRTAPMLLATLGITLSALVSAVTGQTTLGLTLIACIWAYGCGLLQTLGGGLWWVSLQCVIFALIASSFPVGLADTATRTVMVLAGGLLQMLCPTRRIIASGASVQSETAGA